VGVAVAATMSNNGTIKAAHSSRYGSLIVNAAGMTLYHFTPDKQGAIKCTTACAKFWPPLVVKAGTKPTAGAGIAQAKLSTVKRPDGKTQVTYAGLTLYRYAGDAKAGDVKGEGVEGTWFVVTSKGTLAKAPAAATGGTPPPSYGTTTDMGGGGYGY
jgi:predicted lipoprotein with Yx(FWY)xxD motif